MIDKLKVLLDLVLKILQITALTIQLVVLIREILRMWYNKTSKPPE